MSETEITNLIVIIVLFIFMAVGLWIAFVDWRGQRKRNKGVLPPVEKVVPNKPKHIEISELDPMHDHKFEYIGDILCESLDYEALHQKRNLNALRDRNFDVAYWIHESPKHRWWWCVMGKEWIGGESVGRILLICPYSYDTLDECRQDIWRVKNSKGSSVYIDRESFVRRSDALRESKALFFEGKFH